MASEQIKRIYLANFCLKDKLFCLVLLVRFGTLVEHYIDQQTCLIIGIHNTDPLMLRHNWNMVKLFYQIEWFRSLAYYILGFDLVKVVRLVQLELVMVNLLFHWSFLRPLDRGSFHRLAYLLDLN